MTNNTPGKAGTRRRPRVTRRCPEQVASFGQRLRQALRHLDITQQYLAERLGKYRPDAVLFLVNGKSSQVAIDMVIRLAEFMDFHGISLRWLFAGQGEMRAADALASKRDALLLQIARKLGVEI